MNLYDIKVKKINGDEISLEEYKGKTILVVNTASKCGFTKQYEGLQRLYEEYREKDFVILGFPCNQFASQEPEDEAGIESFCSLNFGVTFPLFSKVDVNGENEHPLYTYLKSKQKGIFGKKIKWNFTKFLIDKNGDVIKRYSPTVTPDKIRDDIGKNI